MSCGRSRLKNGLVLNQVPDGIQLDDSPFLFSPPGCAVVYRTGSTSIELAPYMLGYFVCVCPSLCGTIDNKN